MSKPQTVSLGDYDKILNMQTLLHMGGPLEITNVHTEERENSIKDMMETFVIFDVYKEGEWIGQVSTKGNVMFQLTRMLEHGLKPHMRVSNLQVVKAERSNSLYFKEYDPNEVPF